MFKKIISKIQANYTAIGQAVGAVKVARSSAHLQFALVALGMATLMIGAESNALAIGQSDLLDHNANYQTGQIDEAIKVIFTMLEGSFGALIAVGAGIMAVISSAFGQYRAALGCLIVAVGAFILRSFVFTWFNVETIDPNGGI